MTPTDTKRTGKKWLALGAAVAAAAGALLGTLAVLYVRPDRTSGSALASDRESKLSERQADGSRRRQPPSVPVLTPAEGAAAVPDHEALDPASDRYDPRRARPMLRPLEIFLQEPRDATWAPAVESWLNNRLQSDLAAMVPETRDLAVECRTATCLIKWTGSPEVDRKVKTVYEALYMATEADFVGQGRILAIMGGSRGPFAKVPRSDPSAFTQRMDDLRAASIRLLDRKTTLIATFPRGLWPKE